MHCILYTQFLLGNTSFLVIILGSCINLQRYGPMLIRICKIVYNVIVNVISELCH